MAFMTSPFSYHGKGATGVGVRLLVDFFILQVPMKKAIKLAISVGDTNGIGLEIALKTFKDKRMFDFCTPVVFAEHHLVHLLNRKIGLDEHSFRTISSLAEVKTKKINVLNCWKQKITPQFGQSTKEGGD